MLDTRAFSSALAPRPPGPARIPRSVKGGPQVVRRSPFPPPFGVVVGSHQHRMIRIPEPHPPARDFTVRLPPDRRWW